MFYEDQDFQGKSYDCKGDSSDLHSYIRRCNSVKVEGGWWVLFERDNFTGYQYVVGPGEYNNYRLWMGFNDCVRSCRIIKNVIQQAKKIPIIIYTYNAIKMCILHSLSIINTFDSLSCFYSLGQRTVQADVVWPAQLWRQIFGTDRKCQVCPRKMAPTWSPVLQGPGGLLGFLWTSQLLWSPVPAGARGVPASLRVGGSESNCVLYQENHGAVKFNLLNLHYNKCVQHEYCLFVSACEFLAKAVYCQHKILKLTTLLLRRHIIFSTTDLK